jgi:N-acetylmuramoyl-L-alanine amidase
MSYSLRHNPADPSNLTVGRQGNAISEIIIHHAAGTYFDAIANTFKNPARDASAHYAVGRNNNVDIMVAEGNIAWHCGNWWHNSRSIGIENVNSSGDPSWDVANETKNTLVELCADIVRRNPSIGKLVPGKNLFGHKQVADASRPTACPVTLIAFLQPLADRVNAMVSGQPAPSTPSQPSGRKSNEQIAAEVLVGLWGNGDDRRSRLQAAGYDYSAIQNIVNGRVGISPTAPRKSVATVAAEVLAGAWGNNPERRARLVAAGYDYAAVQAEVNRIVGGSAPPQPVRTSVDVIADQVIAGSWGNGDERRVRLTNAGYSYAEVQAAVNRKLGMGGGGPARKSNDQVANEIIAGQGNWGNGDTRRARLQAAGYDYNTVQAIVNRKLGF